MQIHRGLPDLGATPGCELCIGNFDGVHRGHLALIGRAVAAARARGRWAGVLTFDPHPMRVLRPDASFLALTTLEERLALLKAAGVDAVIIYPFTAQTAQMGATDFMRELAARLGLRRLWVGPDFALGRRREGDVPMLRRLGSELGFEVATLEPIVVDGVEVRSGAIRAALTEGRVDQAARLLGRPYVLTGVVVSGSGRGRTIGLPTVNLPLPAERVIPANGVYAAWCWVEGQRLPAATNVGVRPTFDGRTASIEAHLLGFEGDLYGVTLRLEFVLRLRPERRFADVDALIAQVRRDVANTRRALAPGAPRFEEVEHTADWRMRVWGDDWADLLAQAGAAMFALQGATLAREPERWREVVVEAPDREALLVMWLSELLYLSETGNESYTRFVIDDASAEALSARVGAIAGMGEKAHIKAVTYHDLRVEETPQGWTATVLFDT